MRLENKNKIGFGEARAELADAWFKFLGYSAVTGVFHAAANASDHLALVAIKWLCYVFMWWWLEYKVDKIIWLFFPSSDPTKKRAQPLHISIAVAVSLVVAVLIYMVIATTIRALLTLKGAV